MKVVYSTGSVCARSATATKKSATTIIREKRILEHLQNDEGEIVILLRTRGKPVGALNHRSHDILRGAVTTHFGCRDEPLFTPFLEVGGHGFANSIGVPDEDVVGLKLQLALLILNIGEDAQDRSTGFQPLHHARTIRAA